MAGVKRKRGAAYKYKPGGSANAIGASAFSLKEVMRARVDPALRVFRQGIGWHIGRMLLGSSVPWKGATQGAASGEEALNMLSNVNSSVASGLRNAIDMGRGVTPKGAVWVMDAEGNVGKLSRRAYELNQKGPYANQLTIVPNPYAVGARATTQQITP